MIQGMEMKFMVKLMKIFIKERILPAFITIIDISILHHHQNFQILELEFEEYELIVSKGDLWVLESKDIIPDCDIIEIKENISKLFYLSQNKIIKEFGEDLVEKRNELYGKLLIDYISNLKFNITLERKGLN